MAAKRSDSVAKLLDHPFGKPFKENITWSLECPCAWATTGESFLC